MAKISDEKAKNIVFSYINQKGMISLTTLADAYDVSLDVVKAVLEGRMVPLSEEDSIAIATIQMNQAKENFSVSGGGFTGTPAKHSHVRHSKRSPKISSDAAKALALELMSEGLTVSGLQERHPDCSVGTLYNALRNLEYLGPDLYAQVGQYFEDSRRNATRNCPNNIGKGRK